MPAAAKRTTVSASVRFFPEDLQIIRRIQRLCGLKLSSIIRSALRAELREQERKAAQEPISGPIAIEPSDGSGGGS